MINISVFGPSNTPSLLLFFALILTSQVSFSETTEIKANKHWCKKINAAKPGDTLLLRHGLYNTPCSIRVSGKPGKPITIRSISGRPGQRAVIIYPGNSSNIIDIRNSKHLILQDLDISSKGNKVEGIKIHSSSDITIQRCRFHKLKGVSIAANHGDTERITIRLNEFKKLASTAIYLGCHDGIQCVSKDALIEGNLIDRVIPTDGSVGYGIQIKLNSNATILDNSVYATRGPGIMVYGSGDSEAKSSVVAGNYVQRSATDGGIVLGGGPVVVRNNVAVDNAKAGIVAQDYQNRGLQHGVLLIHNTLYNNLDGGITAENWLANKGNVLANNLIAGSPEHKPINARNAVAETRGNIFCPNAAECLIRTNRAPYDLRLKPDGPHLEKGGNNNSAWSPETDFLGIPRQAPTAPGAFEGIYPDKFDDLNLGSYKRRPKRMATPTL